MDGATRLQSTTTTPLHYAVRKFRNTIILVYCYTAVTNDILSIGSGTAHWLAARHRTPYGIYYLHPNEIRRRIRAARPRGVVRHNAVPCRVSTDPV